MSSTTCEKKLTKRQQKSLAFRKNQRKKSKLITDKGQEAEEDTSVNDVENLDKSIKEKNYLSEQLDSDQNDKCEDIEDRIVQDNQEKDGEELSKHFESAGVPISIRLITDKNTKKQKGFAFIEFDNPQSMKKALLFHHTNFKNRQIRVELTAGGGGNKSEIRRKKLEQKKKKLVDERRKLHKTYIAPKSKRPKDINRNESTSILKTTSQPNNKVQTKVKKPRLTSSNNIKVKKPRLTSSNTIKLNNARAFG
ncbi:19717_t:CDS:2 [Dentiscutata erythropus]|uniref:19717_t:CDS:1 n=1 Tax=Dentiscutata erythropus TaxID=1348616 RepID=A0A9N8VK68_9GLOM|nr:19717_t:CDS:2 [Dentiscutata erythropus]